MPTDLDAQLRDYAARWRAAQPAPPPAKIESEQQDRGTRRRALAIAASVAAVLIVGGAVAVQQRSTPSHPAGPALYSGGVVPWDARGQTLTTTPPAYNFGATGAGTRVCTDRDFTLVSSSTTPLDSRSQQFLTRYELRSTAEALCSISNTGVVFFGDHGQVLQRSYQPNAPIGSDVGPGPSGVAPGDLVTGSVQWATYARPGDRIRPTRLAIQPDQSAAVGSALAVSLRNVQPRSAIAHRLNGQLPTTGMRSTADTPLVGRPRSVALLDPTVIAAKSVRRHATVRYTVRLVNRSSEPVLFTPCPQLRQTISIGVDHVVSKADGRSMTNGTYGPLNCAAAGPVGPHAAITFAFELPTGNLPAGNGNLTWRLAFGNRTAVGNSRYFTITG